MVPVDTDVRSGKRVILGPEAPEEGESFFLGKAEVGLVQLCMVCTVCSLVGHDWEKKKQQKELALKS